MLAELMAGREPFFFAGHCYRRSELQAIGGWDSEQRIEDADLFVRLAQRTKHLIVQEKLFLRIEAERPEFVEMPC